MIERCHSKRVSSVAEQGRVILTRDALPSAAALVGPLHCRNQSDGNSQTHGHGRFQLMKCKYKYKCDTILLKK